MADDKVFLLWDPTNRLVHGVEPTKAAAEDAARRLAKQPGHDYNLSIVAAPAR